MLKCSSSLWPAEIYLGRAHHLIEGSLCRILLARAAPSSRNKATKHIVEAVFLFDRGYSSDDVWSKIKIGGKIGMRILLTSSQRFRSLHSETINTSYTRGCVVLLEMSLKIQIEPFL